MTDAKKERMCLADFGSAVEELFRRWRAVPPIVDDDFEERYYEFRQQLEKVWKNV